MFRIFNEVIYNFKEKKKKILVSTPTWGEGKIKYIFNKLLRLIVAKRDSIKLIKVIFFLFYFRSAFEYPVNVGIWANSGNI